MSIKVEGLAYGYSQSTDWILKNIHFEVPAGTIAVLTGASGSGKTTIARVLTGLVPHYYKGHLLGRLLINDLEIGMLEMDEIAQMVGYLHQNPEQGFFALNVQEELLTSLYWQNILLEQAYARRDLVTDWLGIQNLLDRSVLELSSGEKQKVALAALLMNEGVKVLVLDEPSANLDPDSARELAEILSRLKREGYTILVIDHRLYWLAEIADQALVMEQGKLALQGNFSLLSLDSRRETYALRDLILPEMREREKGEKNPLLQWEDVTFSYDKRTPKPPVFTGFSQSIEPGICALVGDNGSGKSTLARLISGLSEPQSGCICLKGRPIPRRERNRMTGLAVQNVDRALYCSSVLEEVKTASKGRLSRQQAMELLEEFDLGDLHDLHPQALSGGQKQRLVCACLFANPSAKVLILDEPTSGLDKNNMHLIGGAMQRAVDRGQQVILISHDQELIGHYATSQIQLNKLKD